MYFLNIFTNYTRIRQMSSNLSIFLKFHNWPNNPLQIIHLKLNERNVCWADELQNQNSIYSSYEKNPQSCYARSIVWGIAYRCYMYCKTTFILRKHLTRVCVWVCCVVALVDVCGCVSMCVSQVVYFRSKLCPVQKKNSPSGTKKKQDQNVVRIVVIILWYVSVCE